MENTKEKAPTYEATKEPDPDQIKAAFILFIFEKEARKAGSLLAICPDLGDQGAPVNMALEEMAQLEAVFPRLQNNAEKRRFVLQFPKTCSKALDAVRAIESEDPKALAYKTIAADLLANAYQVGVQYKAQWPYKR